ncbi:MAG: hypothetical protein GY750_13730 [Lentisphaerae bacterium]|nr:hypothetical protein [Lentisphaerota bacterium]
MVSTVNNRQIIAISINPNPTTFQQTAAKKTAKILDFTRLNATPITKSNKTPKVHQTAGHLN